MRKIICTVTNDLNFDQRMIRICTSLTDAGYDVTLVGWVIGKATPLLEKKYKQKRFHLFFNKGKLGYFEYNFRLFLWLMFRKVDILNAIDVDTLLANYLVKVLRRKPLVFDAHEYYVELPELVARPKTRAIWKALADYCIPRIEYNYTVCQSLADIFKDVYHRDFEVIRNVPFLSLKNKNTVKKHDKKIILYQGWLNLGRGLPEMIRAMQFIDAEFWMAGDGDITKDLMDLVKELNLTHKVKFLGKLPPSDLKSITEQAYIGINLLENLGLNNYYSLANKTFDYIQAGIPAIHMDFPEYQHLNNEYDIALLLSDLKVETILTSVNLLLNNMEVYNRLKDNTFNAAKFLNWEWEAVKLLGVYGGVGN